MLFVGTMLYFVPLLYEIFTLKIQTEFCLIVSTSHCSALVLVNGERRFLAVTPELIFLKFGKNDYVSHATPRAKNGGCQKRGVASGYRWSCQVACFFIFFYFLVTSTHLQLTMRRVAWRSMHPKTCFGGRFVPRGSFFWGGNSALFYPKKHFLSSDNG